MEGSMGDPGERKRWDNEIYERANGEIIRQC